MMKKKIFGLLFAVFAATIMSVTANAEYITEGGLKFDTETGVIYGCDKYEVKGDIIIPSEINGVKVIGIDADAFKYCEYITSVTIPDGVISIGDGAFRYCSGMTSVKIPGSVTAIGESAFLKCDSLGNIVLPDKLTSIGADAFYRTAYYDNESNWENGVLYVGKYLISANNNEISEAYTIKHGTRLIADRAFSMCSNLESVTIPNSVEIIGTYAFSESGLKNVTISDSVKIIGFGAFESSNLESVIIPAGVEEINASFASCKSLESITAVAGNKYYSSEDGVLFNKDKTVLVCYPAGRQDSEYKVPKSVTTIGEYSFYGGATIESVWIPSSVTRVEKYAFQRIPFNFNDVYYESSQDDVTDNLSIGEGNLSLRAATAHYDAAGIPTITVEVESDFTGDAAVFDLTVTEGSVSTVKKVKLYLAEYGSEGQITNVYIGENGEAEFGEMTITAPLPSEDAYAYKYMLWEKSNAPLMEAITDISQE